MKKMFLSVAIVLATVGVAQANNYYNYDVRRGVEQLSNENEVVKNNESQADSTQYNRYITAFYDVDRIVIKNKNNEQIRIYNSSWNLVEETNESVSLDLTPGNYYVETRKRIKAQFISTD